MAKSDFIGDDNELRLENHAQSMQQLRSTMARLGVKLSPHEFIECVSRAFQEAQERLPRPISSRKDESSFTNFLAVLQSAKQDFQKTIAVGVLGCGPGLAGVGPSFAAGIVAEVLGDQAGDIQEIQIASGLLTDDQAVGALISQKRASFDLLVSFSFLHFLPFLTPAFEIIGDVVRPAGAFVSSHEPNARYWRNTECRSAFAGFQRSKRPRQLLSSVRMKLSGLGAARVSGSVDLHGVVNAELREGIGAKADLTDNEIRRIVDVHRPGMSPSDFRIGLEGFDVEVLKSSYLNGFELTQMLSSGLLGYNEPRNLPPRWQSVERALAEKYPLDGCLFSSYWKRR